MISIHALREEGDASYIDVPATCVISIHALREEGDPGEALQETKVQDISIHALREEGDPYNGSMFTKSFEISIHALREEGDKMREIATSIGLIFLSTPSARRATLEPEIQNYSIGFLSTPSARRATAPQTRP